MTRIRLPLAALAICLLAACESAAPTAPVQLNTEAAADTISRGGTLLGSGN
ncbi:MAG TPA: hypothetical protein VGR37_08785 [Longimicrobiaceae bacterium]|nr:hypothetical protein [Longimicrobiaceae bacterium]